MHILVLRDLALTYVSVLISMAQKCHKLISSEYSKINKTELLGLQVPEARARTEYINVGGEAKNIDHIFVVLA